jgi:hypothetical protein
MNAPPKCDWCEGVSVTSITQPRTDLIPNANPAKPPNEMKKVVVLRACENHRHLLQYNVFK